MSREEYIEEYCRHLKGLGISNNIIEDVAEDKNSYTPIFEMSCFMKASWNDVVDLEDSSGWLSNTLNMLQGNGVDRNKMALSFYDESEDEWQKLRSSVESLVASNVNESDLLTLIRACQKNILGSMYQHLDGGYGGDYSLYETCFRGGEMYPLRSFSDMEDYFMDYDPLRVKK
ncbi:hypothetical protein [Aliamphritea spongicola]|uniref:hypothetical protein n=1 Tax=Aliamphritea spongicola TaxID=707589 RepID=UPI00196B8662|nr:hypothetical protein [Aliamphritea spongicola]MBN3564712.1 hypothetical protein [Aliamphritea spongicola]